MGRGKANIKKIDCKRSRQITYAKRRDGLLRKAEELSVLCASDVGVIMFSPSSRLTTFATDARVEDAFIRFFDQAEKLRGRPQKEEQEIIHKLKRLKFEGEMIKQIANVQRRTEIDTKISDANPLFAVVSSSVDRPAEIDMDDQREAALKEFNMAMRELQEAYEKLRFYMPDILSIETVNEAKLQERLIMNALKRVRKLKEDYSQKKTKDIEIPSKDIEEDDRTSEESVVFDQTAPGEKSINLNFPSLTGANISPDEDPRNLTPRTKKEIVGHKMSIGWPSEKYKTMANDTSSVTESNASSSGSWSV